MATPRLVPQKPTGAFIGVSWLVTLIGVVSYCVGLYHAEMELGYKGLYLNILISGLFAVISVQKTVRDKAEGIHVTGIYYGVAWGAVIFAVSMMTVCLWNAKMDAYETGVYGLAMVISLFGVIAVQKNVRDLAVFAEIERYENPKEAEQNPDETEQPQNRW